MSDGATMVKVNSTNETPRGKSGLKAFLLNNLVVVGQRGGY